MYVPQFVYSLADEHFQFLAVMKNATMNIYEQVFVLANIFISVSN